MYLETAREAYEAWVIYSFFMLMLEFFTHGRTDEEVRPGPARPGPARPGPCTPPFPVFQTFCGASTALTSRRPTRTTLALPAPL